GGRMRAFVLGEDQSITLRIREILLRVPFDCPAAHLMSLDAADRGVVQSRPELIVLSFSPEPQRGLETLVKVRASSRTHIVAVGPGDDPKLILNALRNGANEFIDEAELEGDLSASLARFVAATSEAKPGRILAVLSPSGGSGSSTIAVNLATALAKKRRS